MRPALPLVALHFAWARYRWATLRGPALARFQARRARRIVAYARRHSSFYRAHWAGYRDGDWRALPTVDKQLMMERFDDFNTRGISREAAMELAIAGEGSRDFGPRLHGYTVGLSSGTSGHRGLFVAGPTEQAAWAGTILARTIHGLPRRRLRVAFFLRSNSNLYEQVGGLLIKFRYFDLMLPLDDAIRALNAFQPHIVVAPPGLLAMLAEARGRLRIRPERLISVAEVLEPQVRAALVAAFDVPIHQIYQATEGLLAVSCARGSLHIQEDLVALQFDPLPGGEGRVTPIVTDLWRTTQPIIRYRLNDVLLLGSDRCACGSPWRVVEAIEGRCDDICYFEQRGGGERPFFADTIRRMLLQASTEIEDYQVVQSSRGELRVHLQIRPGASLDVVAAAVRASVAATIESYGCRLESLAVEPTLPLLAPGAKRRRVMRAWR